MNQEAFFVLGPHRSGTSMVTGLLKTLGVDVGSKEDLMEAAPDNPKGFFEHVGMFMVNVQILAKFGGDWFAPPEFPKGWESSPALDELRNLGSAILDKTFAQSERWGCKDPRNCLTFPFWRTVVKCPIRCIIVLRNPLDVCMSLKKRSGLAVWQGAALWLSHVKAALRGSAGLSRHVIVYEDLIANFDKECRLLVDFLGTKTTSAKHIAARAFVESGLRHHRSTSNQLKDHPEIPPAVREAYTAVRLLARASRKGDAQDAFLDSILAECK